MPDHILTPLLCFTKTTTCVFVFSDRTLVIQTVMSDADNAFINCPDLEVKMKEKGRIILYKETELHFTDFQNTRVTNTSKQRFSVRVTNDTIDYVIGMPQVNDTGLYNCTLAHGHTSKTTYAFLLVKGNVFPNTSRTISQNTLSLMVKLVSGYYFLDPSPQSCPNEGYPVSVILLAAGCGLLALYNISTTIVSFSFAVSVHIHDPHAGQLTIFYLFVYLF